MADRYYVVDTGGDAVDFRNKSAALRAARQACAGRGRAWVGDASDAKVVLTDWTKKHARDQRRVIFRCRSRRR